MNRVFVSLFVASMVFMASCGGGGGGGPGGVIAPDAPVRSAELNTEVSKLASGGLLVIDLEGIAPPSQRISGLLDGTSEVSVAPFGMGLVAGLPEVGDGPHTLTFTVSGQQFTIPFSSSTEAIPENLPQFFDGFVADLDERLAGIASTSPDAQESDQISDFRAQLAGFANDFASLDQAEQIDVVRLIQAVFIPSFRGLDDSTAVRARAAEDCVPAGNEVRLGVTAAVAGIAAIVVGLKSGPLTAGSTFVVVGLGLIAAYAGKKAIDAGIVKLGTECLGRLITEITGSESRSLTLQPNPKAAASGLAFEQGVPRRFDLIAKGTYADDVVLSIAKLKSTAQSFAARLDEIAEFLLGGEVGRAQQLVDDILDYETTVEFEPDGSAYAIQDISDDEITGQARGGVGFVTLRFDHARTLPVDEAGTPFTFSLVDTVDDAVPLEQIDVTASLKGQPTIVGIGSITVRKGGVIAGELTVPEGWHSLELVNQPANGGTVTLNDDATGVIFNGPTDYVGRDTALISATVDGQGALGLVTLFTLDNCEPFAVGGGILRDEICYFDTSLTKRELFIRTVFDGFFGQGGGRQYLWTRYVVHSPINGVTILEDTVMRPLDDLSGASDNFEQTRRAQLDSAGVPISPLYFSGREGRFIAGQRLFTSTYSRSGDFESGSSFECNIDRKSTSTIGGTGSSEENGSDDPENPRPPLPFDEFCGTGAVVDQINDLVPNPFPTAPSPG